MTYPKLPTLIEPEVLLVRTAIQGNEAAAAALQRVLDYYEALRFLDVSRYVIMEERLQAVLEKGLQQQSQLSAAINNDYVLQMAKRLDDLEAMLRFRFEALGTLMHRVSARLDEKFHGLVASYKQAEAGHQAGWKQICSGMDQALLRLRRVENWQDAQPKLLPPPRQTRKRKPRTKKPPAVSRRRRA